MTTGGGPAGDGLQLFGWTTASVLTAALTAAVAVRLLSLATSPVGWLLTAAAALVALLIPWLLQRRQRRSSRRLAIGELAPRWAAPVVTAVDQASQLRRLADRAPSGPVAEHLARLADTADTYAVLLHEAALLATGDDAGLEADMGRITDELSDLLAAAERLRVAQQRLLEPSPLVALTARTDRLTASLEGPIGPGSTVDETIGEGPELPPRAGFR